MRLWNDCRKAHAISREEWEYPQRESSKYFLTINWIHTTAREMHICFQVIVLYTYCACKHEVFTVWLPNTWTQRVRTCRSFATRVSQLKIWHFWIIGIERNVCRCTSNRYSVITQFVKLAAGEQLWRRCIIEKYSTSKSLNVPPEKKH